MNLFGIDIGGTKITFALADASGKILKKKRIATPENAKEGIKAIIDEIEKAGSIDAVGISAPGPLSVDQGMLLNLPNLPQWQNIPIISELKKMTNVPLFFNNDANAQALAEFHFGKRKGCKNLVYLTCSTGMGAGIIQNGKLIQGATDTAGEVGHYILNLDGPKCPCGQRGCFEVYCGGKSFARLVEQKMRKEKIDTLLKEIVKDEYVHFEHIEEALRKKDPFVQRMFKEFVMRMAQGLGILVMTLNPEVIILGTIAHFLQDLLMIPLLEAMKKMAWKEPLQAVSIEPTSIYDTISELSGIGLAIHGLQRRISTK